MEGLCKYSLKNYGPINLTSVIYGSSNVNCINVKTNKKTPHTHTLEYMVKTSRSCLGDYFFPLWDRRVCLFHVSKVVMISQEEAKKATKICFLWQRPL